MLAAVALARADKNLKKDIPWISVSAVGMFLGSPTDIQRTDLCYVGRIADLIMGIGNSSKSI